MTDKPISERVAKYMEKRMSERETRERMIDSLFEMAQKPDATGFRALEFIFDRMLGKGASINAAPMFKPEDTLQTRMKENAKES